MSHGRAPVLLALAGRPGTGKTTVGTALALAANALYLRVDTAEHAIATALGREAGTSGYATIQALAADNLALGHDVVADSVNPVVHSREAFARVAREAGARLIEVEVVCSDVTVHRHRLESRAAEPWGHVTWAAMQSHPYEPWTTPRIVLDTARRSVGEAVALLLAQMDRGS